MSYSLWPHGLQHVRLPCPLPSPRDCSNSVSDAIKPSHPLLSPSPPESIFPSIKVKIESSIGLVWLVLFFSPWVMECILFFWSYSFTPHRMNQRTTASSDGCFAILPVFPYFLTLDTFLIHTNKLSLFLASPLCCTVFSVQFSHSVLINSLQPHGLQHARLLCSSPTPKSWSNSCPSSWWCHPTIHLLSSPFPSAFNLSQHQGLFKWVSSSHQVVKILEF